MPRCRLLKSGLVFAVVFAAMRTASTVHADDAPAADAPAAAEGIPKTAEAAVEPTAEKTEEPAALTAEGAAPAAEGDAKTPDKPPPPLPIDQQPYRVLVAIGIAPDVSSDPRYPDSVLAGIKDRIASRLGELWDVDVELAEWLSPGRRTVLDGYTESRLTELYLSSEYDKVFLATLEADGSALRTSALEWDKNSQTATALTSSLCYEPRVVIDRLFAEVLTHFRPIAQIEEISEDGNTVEMRVRGGELIPPDPTQRLVTTGIYLRPYYRYLDRKRELRKLQSVDWTYIQVSGVERGRVQGGVDSAFRAVLAGKRRRTELMAVVVKPRFDATSLRIYPRGQPQNPMAATRVDILNRHPTDEDAVEDRQTLYTNRFGEVAVPADAEKPLQYVYVMSGKSVLAVVPFIPGDQLRTELDVPDDGPRLAVEGEAAILEAELIEVVARREVALNRAIGYARAGDHAKADKLMNEAKNLPTAVILKERLERIRLPAVAEARQTRNRVAEVRINRICKQLEETIDQHLQADRITTIQTEIRELKEAN